VALFLKPNPNHRIAPPIDTTSQVGWAKSLADEALNEQQYRMNQVIYLLTMITVVVLPAQFLTGVFGA